MANARRKQNYISKLQRNDGEVVESQAEVCGVAKEYFDDLFTGDIGYMQHILDMVGPRITQQDNDMLLAHLPWKNFGKRCFKCTQKRHQGQMA
jgi:hypothetical protein